MLHRKELRPEVTDMILKASPEAGLSRGGTPALLPPSCCPPTGGPSASECCPPGPLPLPVKPEPTVASCCLSPCSSGEQMVGASDQRTALGEGQTHVQCPASTC